MEHKGIYAALVAAQSEFGQVKKGSVNPAFKSRYADLADVASVVIPTLGTHGVAVLHYIVGDSLGVMRTEFVHAASGTTVACDVPLIFDRANMQGMKSACTYAKRIGLESLSGIAPEDDDGTAAVQGSPQAPQKAKAPAEWEGKLAKMSHSQRILMAEELKVLATRFDPELGKAVSPDKWTESNSFGGLRSALATVSRAIEMPVNELIEQIEKE